MKRTVIISGGNINYDFALSYLKKYPACTIIGADRGIEFLKKTGIKPNYIVGDFDSAKKETVSWFQNTDTVIHRFCTEKDETDTQIALVLALETGASEIHILGGTGSRLDHVLGNISILYLGMEKGVTCFLVDEHNRIRLINQDTVLKKSWQFGSYVSLIARTSTVTGITLKGFRYPLTDYTMTCGQAIGISNEIEKEEGIITLESGLLILVESRD